MSSSRTMSWTLTLSVTVTNRHKAESQQSQADFLDGFHMYDEHFRIEASMGSHNPCPASHVCSRTLNVSKKLMVKLLLMISVCAQTICPQCRASQQSTVSIVFVEQRYISRNTLVVWICSCVCSKLHTCARCAHVQPCALIYW